jgi:RNA polymerase sigma factor (sigma-70 family)
MTEAIEALVAGCRAGDRAAQSEIARRAARNALRTASVAMGDGHAAADVSQEVAVRVLRGIGDLRKPALFDAWVYRITVSEIRRAYNRRRRDPATSLDADEALALTDRDVDMPGAFLERAQLREALADLPLRERTAIALRYVHDLGDDEIARAMRCRAGTVRSLLSRARARLSAHPALAEHRPTGSPATSTPKEMLS